MFFSFGALHSGLGSVVLDCVAIGGRGRVACFHLTPHSVLRTIFSSKDKAYQNMRNKKQAGS